MKQTNMTGKTSGTTMTSDWRLSDKRFEQRKLLLLGLIAEGLVLFPKVYEFCDFAISQGYGETYEVLTNTDRNMADQWLRRRYEEWEAHIFS